MRASILTTPREEWGNGNLTSITHSKALNVSCDIFGRICSSDYASEIKEKVARLKAHRELISYIAPTSGDNDIPMLVESDLIELCTLFSEIAQIQSEILEVSLHKNAPEGLKFVLKDEYLIQACTANIKDIEFSDGEDDYRLDYLRRKHPMMTNVCQIISEGHAEDFFGSWYTKREDESEIIFNPDDDTQIIFDIP